MARVSAGPPSPGAPRTDSTTTGIATGAATDTSVGGSRAAATLPAACAAMAARSDAVASRHDAPGLGASKRSTVSPSGATSAHRTLSSNAAMRPTSAMLLRLAARVSAGHVPRVQRRHDRFRQRCRMRRRHPVDWRHQDAPPGAEAGARPRRRALPVGWKGWGRAPQAASAAQSSRAGTRRIAACRGAPPGAITGSPPTARSSPRGRRPGRPRG